MMRTTQPFQECQKKLESEFSRPFVCYFLYEVFLLMNLSVPGSANFYRLSVPSTEKHAKTDFNLSASYFEFAWLNSLDGKWPKIEYIPLQSVLKWYNHFQMGSKQIATVRTERALFALLHISFKDAHVDSLVWIAHALEALYETNIGRSFNDLFERTVRLLEIPLEKRKFLKRELRTFYDLRSAFVHGGLDVAHPIGGGFDDIDDKFFERVLYSCEFGANLVVSTIQTLIKNGWSEINYKEEQVGHSIES